jgi:hypothetical protein
MKSSEVLASCPVCSKMVSKEFMEHHIANKARWERKSNLQTNKLHENYKQNSSSQNQQNVNFQG